MARFEVTFANNDEAGITMLVQNEGCIMGLSDAGAHISQICDAVMPTDFLSSWVRDRQVMSLERGVRKLTGEIADVIGVDRGYVRVGSPADIVVIDLDNLSTGPCVACATCPPTVNASSRTRRPASTPCWSTAFPSASTARDHRRADMLPGRPHQRLSNAASATSTTRCMGMH